MYTPRLDQMVILFLIFKRSSIVYSVMGAPTCIPTNSVGDFLFLHMLSCGELFATPWAVACQAPLSMEFSRQEHCSAISFSITWSGCILNGMHVFILASFTLVGDFLLSFGPSQNQTLNFSKGLPLTHMGGLAEVSIMSSAWVSAMKFWAVSPDVGPPGPQCWHHVAGSVA